MTKMHVEDERVFPDIDSECEMQGIRVTRSILGK